MQFTKSRLLWVGLLAGCQVPGLTAVRAPSWSASSSSASPSLSASSSRSTSPALSTSPTPDNAYRAQNAENARLRGLHVVGRSVADAEAALRSIAHYTGTFAVKTLLTYDDTCAAGTVCKADRDSPWDFTEQPVVLYTNARAAIAIPE